ncbi:IS110 family transposase [Asticcacaulis sp. EMRT-3]|uniref:IS110 family transposase n=1 Tax=Asticcacaulis sp. EMRT-3 TaxID=3040349 RepID=UPI0024AEB37D|nr:IS110 family transposase [Asticcacaulis sp. EMRT-3]MDI7774914.1 IS110 family transposase [Asticcacaulis sp. EMRT-3]
MRQFTTNPLMYKSVGIDVSKASLDMHWLLDGTDHSFSNDDEGHARLLAWLEQHRPDRIVFEATGPYHRGLESALKRAGHSYAKLNPWQVRRFVDAIGQQAKTDRCDAIQLARYAALLQPEATQPKSQALDDLAEWLCARRALIKNQTAALNRQKILTIKALKNQVAQRLQQIAEDIAAVDRACRALIVADAKLKAKLEILTSMPGIGEITAIAMIVDMPELGTLDAKQAASLCGLAPVTRQSGQWKGKSFIAKGRSILRRSLFMPALVAVRFNPALKRHYQRLIDAGKPPKLAIVAAMRKIIITANALIRDQRKWSAEKP